MFKITINRPYTKNNPRIRIECIFLNSSSYLEGGGWKVINQIFGNCPIMEKSWNEMRIFLLEGMTHGF